MNINNKFEYTRWILPDIGALDPEPMEKARNDSEEKKIDKIRQKSKLLPVRMINVVGRGITQMPHQMNFCRWKKQKEKKPTT